MLDFPCTNLVIGQTFPDPPVPGIPVWEWDGVRWIGAEGAAGGGSVFEPDTTGNGETFVLQDQPTVNQPRIMGVTDGSEAAPGEVGEVISAYNFVSAAAVSSISGIASITVSPGDWNVSLAYWVATSFDLPYTTGVTGAYTIQVTTNPSIFTNEWFYGFAQHDSPITVKSSTWGTVTGCETAGSIGPGRLNITVPTVLTFNTQGKLIYPAGATIANSSALGVLTARRMR